MTATIDASGKIVMTGGCPFTGSAVPHGSTGVFDLTIKSGGVCLGGPGKTAKGILIVDGATGQILGLAPFERRPAVHGRRAAIAPRAGIAPVR